MIENVMRPLNLNDLADAYHMPDESRTALAAPVIDELRTISAPTGRDDAGIARRGRSVFEPYLDGRPVQELAAAHVELRQLGCQSGLIDEIELARAIPGGGAAQGKR